MKNKPGRPPLPVAERKGFMMRIRMTEDERAAIDAAAAKQGQEASSWVREIAVAKSRRILAQR